jgi:hypothetical protein
VMVTFFAARLLTATDYFDADFLDFPLSSGARIAQSV